MVTRQTGLRADVIRAWERRYRVIEPHRTPTNRRLYSDVEILRLKLIRQAIQSGWQISQVAGLADDEIRGLLAQPGVANPQRGQGRPVSEQDPVERFIDMSLQAIADLDGDRLQQQLEAASLEFGRVALLDRFLGPLMERVGDSYATGRIRSAHEHLATHALRAFLDGLRPAFVASESASSILVTTPTHQYHELAAMLVAAIARCEGWRTAYLGPNLPAEEIAAAVRQLGVQVLALSITFPDDDAQVAEEIRKLARLLPTQVEFVVGGRSAPAYEAALVEVGATVLTDMAAFRGWLAQVRTPLMAKRR